MMLTDLADVVRRSGLPVTEVTGWQTRGHGQMRSTESITCHHTAGPVSGGGDYPSMGTVVNGRPGLDGPLAQLGLGRSGRVYVIAAGLCWHAGASLEWWQTNPYAIGIEAEHPGGDHPWPAVQYDAYVALCRTLATGYDVPVSRVRGHKENAAPLGRKPDPNFDMSRFRNAVALWTPGTPPPGEDDDMSLTPQEKAQLTAVYNQTRANAGLMVSLSNNLTALMQREWSGDAETEARLVAIQRDIDAVQAELAQPAE